MNVEYDFDKVSLLPSERRALRKVHHSGSYPADQIHNFRILYEYDFLSYDLSDDRDSAGAYIKLPSVHVTDKYLRLYGMAEDPDAP